MKKYCYLFLICIICYICSACGKMDISNKANEQSMALQPNSYFPQNEERFILVDSGYQQIGNEQYYCKVFADKYMGTMYLLIESAYGQASSSLTQIFYEDGSPMIFDTEVFGDIE